MKKLRLLLAGFVVALFMACGLNLSAYAYTDEILEYTITADVNEDASVNLYYHISWKVLDSDSLGPLDWIQVGIPNSHNWNLEAQSDTISSIGYMSSSNNKLRIDLDRKYYAGEIVDIDFSLTQDYMYLSDIANDVSTYTFTPGWFDDIKVDKLVIRWSDADKAVEWTPTCYVEDDNYLSFETTLGAGDRYTITITYPTSAFSFDTSAKEYADDDYYSNDYRYDEDDAFETGVGGLVFLAFIIFIVKMLKKVSTAHYNSGAGLEPTKVITRKMITYYPTCPGCGAVREEEQTKCEYCGRSFIEKEEVITEKKICDDSKYAKEGSYKYNDNPNVYIHVSSRMVTPPKPSHSSCAHSSCACACASCACACACACAGGGRAGCSTKDFYNTGLKLKQLKIKTRK